MTLATYLHVGPTLKMSGSIPPVLHISSWRVQATHHMFVWVSSSCMTALLKQKWIRQKRFRWLYKRGVFAGGGTQVWNIFHCWYIEILKRFSCRLSFYSLFKSCLLSFISLLFSRRLIILQHAAHISSSGRSETYHHVYNATNLHHR